MIDNGNNMNGDLIASLLTSTSRTENFRATIVSTSIANPSVPGTFNVRRHTVNDSRKVFPIRDGAKVGVVDVGLLLRGRSTPMM